MIEVLSTLIVFFNGILYRLGGAGKKGTWLDFARDTLTRDIGCPLMALSLLFLWVGFDNDHIIRYILFLGLSWLALTTYWDETDIKIKDKICRKINWIYPADNFYLHGLGCGLAGLVLWSVVPWWILIARLIVCPVGMGLWSKLVKRDIPQEFGRGVFFII